MLRDHKSARENRWGFPRLLGSSALLHFSLGASALTFSGISEGAKTVLPPSISATNLTVQAIPSFGATELAFMLEANGSTLRQLTSSPPFSVTFSNLSPGKYLLAVQSVNGPAEAGDVSFDIQPPSFQPENDCRSMASAISALDQSVLGTNVFATAEPGEPQHAQNGGGRSIWWRWQADSDRLITATSAGSSFDTVLAVYTLTNSSDLISVVANDDAGLAGPFSQVTFPARSGTTYFIAIDGALQPNGSVATGRAEVRLLTSTPPSVVFVAPTNGYSGVVWSAVAATDLGASANVTDEAGLSRVEYKLDGSGVGGARAGLLSAPYQWTLGQLPPGDYLLTVSAVNTAGLVASAHTGFSLLDASAKLQLLERIAVAPATFPFGVIGLKGTTYELQAAPDLASWDRLALWTNFDGARRVTDTNAAQYRARFYRVIVP